MTHLARRFNPLVLAEGEEYIRDFAASLSQTGNQPSSSSLAVPLKGRLRVCSKSLIFDPEQGLAPLLKFTYATIQRLEQHAPSICWKSDKVTEVRVRRIEGKTRIVESYVTRKDKLNGSLTQCCWLLQPDFADIDGEYNKITMLWKMRHGISLDLVQQLVLAPSLEFDMVSHSILSNNLSWRNLSNLTWYLTRSCPTTCPG